MALHPLDIFFSAEVAADVIKMASEMATLESKVQSNVNNCWPRSERQLQKKLRNTGQEYVSRSGKIIPAKKQPEILCQCPQKCGDKVPQDVRRRLFTEFYRLGDHALQNEFLMEHIETRAVQKRSSDHKIPGRNQRRVSCKYHVPLIKDDSPLIESGLAGVPIVEVCQKAFMHVFAITEKRVRLQREKLISQCSIQPIQSPPHPSTPNVIDPWEDREIVDAIEAWQGEEPIDLRRRRDSSPMLKNPDKDIALVDSFFLNQLWKPKYIGKAT